MNRFSCAKGFRLRARLRWTSRRAGLALFTVRSYAVAVHRIRRSLCSRCLSVEALFGLPWGCAGVIKKGRRSAWGRDSSLTARGLKGPWRGGLLGAARASMPAASLSLRIPASDAMFSSNKCAGKNGGRFAGLSGRANGARGEVVTYYYWAGCDGGRVGSPADMTGPSVSGKTPLFSKGRLKCSRTTRFAVSEHDADANRREVRGGAQRSSSRISAIFIIAFCKPVLRSRFP